MGQTLDNGIYLPSEGERNCYDGLAANWRALDAHLGNTDIHVTYADKQAWNEHVADTVKHVTASDKQTWNGKQDALSQTQLDAVNSGIDSSKVQQIATNTSDISSLQSGKANDSDVVHKSGNEYIKDTKTFGKGTLIVDNGTGSNVHGEIKLNGSRPGYIVADNASDGVFDSAGCGISILLLDAGKPLHIGGYKVDSNGRVFANNTNKNPILSITGSFLKTATLVPENDTVSSAFKILSQLDYANGNTSKLLDVRFVQYDNANGSSAIYSNVDGKTSLGISSKKWSDVLTYKVNGVEPSSLSLPNYSSRIDISSYITNLNGTYNAFTPSVDGWIAIQSSDATFIRIADTGSGGTGNTTTSQNAGILTCMMPVRANRQSNIYIVCTTLTSAYFIPCQGNV